MDETRSMDGVNLRLPVGNIKDDYTLEIVIRAQDIYGGVSEVTVTTKVNIQCNM